MHGEGSPSARLGPACPASLRLSPHLTLACDSHLPQGQFFVCNPLHFLFLLLNVRFIKRIRSTFSAKTSTMGENSQSRGSDEPSTSSCTTEPAFARSCWGPSSASSGPSSWSSGARVHTASTPALSSSSTTGRSCWKEPRGARILRRLLRLHTAALPEGSPKLTSG